MQKSIKIFWFYHLESRGSVFQLPAGDVQTISMDQVFIATASGRNDDLIRNHLEPLMAATIRSNAFVAADYFTQRERLGSVDSLPDGRRAEEQGRQAESFRARTAHTPT